MATLFDDAIATIIQNRDARRNALAHSSYVMFKNPDWDFRTLHLDSAVAQSTDSGGRIRHDRTDHLELSHP